MEENLRITILDGWTLVSIFRTSSGQQGAVGACVLLLQENLASARSSCSVCASGGPAHRFCAMILPLSRIVGPAAIPATWLLLCTSCSIALIDGWLKEKRRA